MLRSVIQELLRIGRRDPQTRIERQLAKPVTRVADDLARDRGRDRGKASARIEILYRISAARLSSSSRKHTA